jgi:exodeoxyribonuclease-5
VSIKSNEWEGGVEIVALCGKAANVLRNKGVGDAQTIHRLIYDPIKDQYGKTKFILKEVLPGCEIIIVDESSMVNRQLYEDLLSFNKPILFVGDHGQLEPIGDNPNLMANPEIRLEKIHRQAENNPILRLAAALREGRSVPQRWKSSDGALTLETRDAFWRAVENLEDYQYICGYNKTRHDVNKIIRMKRGFDKVLHEGDVVICLKNNYDFNVFNGMQATVRKIRSMRGRNIEMQIETEDGEVIEIPCLKEQFGREVFKDHMDREVALFDYGYCLTCHKSQGSEYPRVAVIREVASMWDPRRWEYTAATRPRDELLYCA